MYEVKILNKDDSLLAEKCFKIYGQRKIKHVKYDQIKNQEDELTENQISFLRTQYYSSTTDDYAIAAAIKNNEVIGFQIGCKLHIMYERSTPIFPYWYVLAHAHKNFNQNAKILISSLIQKLTNHFEQQKYYTFYVLVRLPFNMTITNNIDDYLDNIYQKNYPVTRYRRYIEQVCYDNESLKKICKLYQGYYRLFPLSISRPIVLLKYEAINNYRQLL